MPSRRIEDADLILQNAWKIAVKLFVEKYPNDSVPFVTCTHRTPQEQLELYAQGRTKKGKIVTYLKTGSKHNFMPSKAIDIAFKKSDGSLDWSPILFEKFQVLIRQVDHRINWGGSWKRFKDLPHFEID